MEQDSQVRSKGLYYCSGIFTSLQAPFPMGGAKGLRGTCIFNGVCYREGSFSLATSNLAKWAISLPGFCPERDITFCTGQETNLLFATERHTLSIFQGCLLFIFKKTLWKNSIHETCRNTRDPWRIVFQKFPFIPYFYTVLVFGKFSYEPWPGS